MPGFKSIQSELCEYRIFIEMNILQLRRQQQSFQVLGQFDLLHKKSNCFLFNFFLRSSPEVPFLNAQIWALLCDVDVEAEFVLFFNRKSLAVRLNIPFLSLRWKQGKICIYGTFSFCEILLEVCINGYGHGCQKTMGNGLG